MLRWMCSKSAIKSQERHLSGEFEQTDLLPFPLTVGILMISGEIEINQFVQIH